MKHMTLILFILAGGLSLQATAATCMSAKEMDVIAKDFRQFADLAGREYCFNGSQTSNLLESLYFMRNTAFESKMPKSQDDLFSGRFANGWYQYFIGRIKDIDVQSNCPKGVGAYVYGWGNTMYVCPMILTNNFSVLDRASIFMHEARHIDGFPHTTCRSGARAGLQGACDTKISDGGSYAVSVETYAQLARYGTDIHPALKAYSMASAVTYADEAFQTPARVDRSQSLLILTKDRQFHNLDLTLNDLSTLGQSPEEGFLVSRSQSLILFPFDRTKDARYVFVNNEGEVNQSAGELVSKYNEKTPAERAQLIDLHIGGRWAARLYTNEIEFQCDPRSDTVSKMNIPKGKAIGFLYLDGYDRGSQSTQILVDTGDIFEAACDSRSLKPSITLSSRRLPGDLVRAHQVAGRTFGVSRDGLLYEIENNQAILIKTGFTAEIDDIAQRQVFRFFDSSTAD